MSPEQKREVCWFCKKTESVESAAAWVPMCKITKMQSSETTYRRVDQSVPRCLRCAGIHKFVDRILLIGSAAGCLFVVWVFIELGSAPKDASDFAVGVTFFILFTLLISVILRGVVRLFTPRSVKFEGYAKKWPTIQHPGQGIMLGSSPDKSILQFWKYFGTKVR